MSSLFPNATIVPVILVLIIGFGLHWLARLLSVFNWDIASRLGLQEKNLLPEYKVCEHAITIADAALGWLCGIAAIGELLNAE